jgi:hypothetical protein
MKKYRKRTPEIEAFRWEEPAAYSEGDVVLPKSVHAIRHGGKWEFHVISTTAYMVKLRNGDWVIPHAPEPWYASRMTAEDFERIYEPVEE